MKNLAPDLQVAEACWRQYLAQPWIRWNNVVERSKSREAWHAAWIACTEYHKARR